MSFFSNLINWLRGITSRSNKVINPAPTDFVFGSIISGQYLAWKHDPNPTILCLGNYLRPTNGRWYVHGIQLHALPPDDFYWLMSLIQSMKQNGTTTNPRAFYYYLKNNRYSIVKNGYRIYHTELTKFKTINPGFSNMPDNYCINPTDGRDTFFMNKKPVVKQVNPEELKQNITNALNTKKIW